MILKPQISVIVPTYNRSKYIEKILQKFVSSSIPHEIIICDGGSKVSSKIKVKKIIEKYNFQNIRYIDVGINNHSIKRNKGIKSALAKYIVLLDDDCFPEKKFLEKYFKILEKYKFQNYLFCGSVKYPSKLMNKKFIQYRQSRHFIIKKNNTKYFLHPKNIVTMNMAFKKKLLFEKDIFFYEKFNMYGFEDYEFGYRLKENNLKMMACSPSITHYDERSLKEYLNKIKFVGFEGGHYLVKINKKASLANNFIKLQNSMFARILRKSSFILKILIFLEEKFVFFEKKLLFPNFMYKVMIANAYLIGYFMSDNKKNDKNFPQWYK